MCLAVDSRGTAPDDSLDKSFNKRTPAWSTVCCRDISFTNSPPSVSGDSDKYQSALSHKLDFIFQFAVTVPPEDALTISIVVHSASGNTTTLAWTEPKSIKFTLSSASLTGSFLLLGEPGAYVIELVPQGTLSSSYYSTSTLVNISKTLIVAAPELTEAKFENSGARAYVRFSRPTDYGATVPALAGLTAGQWNCSAVFDFTGCSRSTTCEWLDTTTVQLTFSNQKGLKLLGLNDPLTLLPNKIKALCASSFAAECKRYPFSPRSQPQY